jgi:antirestriction protein ArdC
LGQAVVGKPRREYPLQCYSGCNVVLLWMARAAGYRSPRFLTFKQALELGGNVRKGEHGTKVYFVKQLQVRDQGADDSSSTRLIPMVREYTVFNVDQCENLPDQHRQANPRSQSRHARRAC